MLTKISHHDTIVNMEHKHEIAIQNEIPQYKKEILDLIKSTVASELTEQEFKLFLYQCTRTGLDPLCRQIHPIKRNSNNKNKMSIQIGIDGMRIIAERTNKYLGQVGPWWCGEDGIWKDVWLSSGSPVAAKVGILREGFKEPIYAVARFSSYCQSDYNGKLTHVWAKMGDIMIAKCAEALGIRKAFPHDLSGLYITEEMQQIADPEHTVNLNQNHANWTKNTSSQGQISPNIQANSIHSHIMKKEDEDKTTWHNFDPKEHNVVEPEREQVGKGIEQDCMPESWTRTDEFREYEKIPFEYMTKQMLLKLDERLKDIAMSTNKESAKNFANTTIEKINNIIKEKYGEEDTVADYLDGEEHKHDESL
jgi:phage recombination protein Bet